MDLDEGNPFLGAFEGVGPDCHFWAHKSLDFRAHPFKRPLLWITPPSKSICPSPYKQQVH